MSHRTPKPDRNVMRRVEELLREQLDALGEDISAMPPHEITRNMLCSVRSDGSLSYSWQGRPLLDVEPGTRDDGSVEWRFFTHDAPMQ